MSLDELLKNTRGAKDTFDSHRRILKQDAECLRAWLALIEKEIAADEDSGNRGPFPDDPQSNLKERVDRYLDARAAYDSLRREYESRSKI